MPRPRTKEPGQAQKEYAARALKQIPLKYKKEIAETIYTHAETVGSSPITWIKEAIEEKYKRETGKRLRDQIK